MISLKKVSIFPLIKNIDASLKIVTEELVLKAISPQIAFFDSFKQTFLSFITSTHL